MRALRIALLGGRGVPARYGGFETLMEELGSRLAENGHSVTVYCRSRYTPRGIDHHRGVRLVRLPSLYTKHLETPAHTALACLHAVRERFDVALMVNGANAFFCPVLQLAGTPVALSVDGIERQRAKWGRLGQIVYLLSERLAVLLPKALVTDAEVISNYYLERHRAKSTVLTYGVEPEPVPSGETLARLRLEPNEYFLYVSRFEPENNAHRVVEAYRKVNGEMPLVMVGDAPYASSYIRRLKRDADPRVVFPGAIYGPGYRELLSHARAYVQATEVGGTHPALVEAMGYGNCVVVNDTPENREVAGGCALYFKASSSASLASHLERLRTAPERAKELGELSARRARAQYSWLPIVRGYERLFRSMVAGKKEP